MKIAVGPSMKKSAALKSKQGVLLTDRVEQMDHWVEHISELYSREPLQRSNPDLIQNLPSLPVYRELDDAPSIQDLGVVLNNLTNRKAPGVDGVLGEVLKANAGVLVPFLHQLLLHYWEGEEIPKKLINALIKTLYKHKGDRGILR